MVSAEVLHEVKHPVEDVGDETIGLVLRQDIGIRFAKFPVDKEDEAREVLVFDDACARSERGYGTYMDDTVRFDAKYLGNDTWVRSLNTLESIANESIEYWHCIAKIAFNSLEYSVFTSHKYTAEPNGNVTQPKPGSTHVLQATPEEIQRFRNAPHSTYFSSPDIA